MNRRRFPLVQSALVVFVAAAAGCSAELAQPAVAHTVVTAPPPAPAPDPAQSLRFAELFASEGALRISDRAQELIGQRVRMIGFMAELEQPPLGAFYLTPNPVRCDEAGAGTGDLPVGSVLVSAPFLNGAKVPHVPGAIEVVGTFEAGNQVADGGYPATFRIRLDASARGPQPEGSAAAKSQVRAQR